MVLLYVLSAGRYLVRSARGPPAFSLIDFFFGFTPRLSCSQIRGNVFWNGPPNMPLGNGDGGCGDSNPTCNTNQLLADNKFNTLQPVFVNVAANNFRVPAGVWPLNPLDQLKARFSLYLLNESVS